MNRWNKPFVITDTPWHEPYLLWATRTLWRGFRRAHEAAGVKIGAGKSAPETVRILARAKSSSALDKALATLNPQGKPVLEVAPIYLAPVPGGDGRRALHFTANVALADLDRLDKEPFNLRWELAVPLREAQSIVQSDRLGRFEPERDAAAMPGRAILAPPQRAYLPVAGTAKRTPRKGANDVIAVIDYGCPFLNLNFVNAAGKSRIIALWDQQARDVLKNSQSRWWSTPARSGYGRELSGKAINAMLSEIANRRAGGELLDEAAIYRSLDYLIAYRDPRRRAFVATHGGHVLDVAGGTLDPLSRLRGDEAVLAKQPDAAGKAKLVFVQLPGLTAADSSGGSLGAQLLDGVRHVLDLSEDEARVVVNISYGSFASAHDGTSLIETALDELLAMRQKNLAIVLAAGNSRTARCHVRRPVSNDKGALLRFALAPGDTTDTFVELWYPRPNPGSPALALRVRTPSRDWSEWVAPGQQCTLHDESNGRVLAQVQNVLQASGSERNALMLLSLVPTAPAVDDDGPLSETGPWEIGVRLHDLRTGKAWAKAHATIELDAWIERDDPGDGSPGRQVSFLDQDRDDDRNTLSSLATGKSTVVVGGYRREDDRPVDYSSLPAAGARPRTPPMVLGLCEEDATTPTIRAAAVRSTDSHRMNGTSVAAPVVARQLFNAMFEPDPKSGALVDCVGPGGQTRLLKRLAGRPESFVRLPPEDDIA